MKRLLCGVIAATLTLSASGCKAIFGDDFLACIGNGPPTFKSAAFVPALLEVKAGSPALKLTLETVGGCSGFAPGNEAVTLSPQLGTVEFKNLELRYTPPATIAAPTDVTLTVKLVKYSGNGSSQGDLEPSVILRVKP